MTRPFRFAVQTGGTPTAEAWRDLARRTEALGYSTLQLSDHYLGLGPVQEATSHPPQWLAAMPAIAVAAEVTTTLRVGAGMFCVDYHVPAVLAKEVATLDLLSGGRVEVGLGAGWLAEEYAAMGVPFDPAPRRLERLAEVVQLLDAHAAGGLLDVRGRHVTAAGYTALPARVQCPRPPVMIGGGGRRVLGLAGALADIVHINFDNRSGVIGEQGVRSSTAARTAEKVQWIRDGAGERFDGIELATSAYFAAVVDDPGARATSLGRVFGLEAADVLDHPNALLGPVEAIVDILDERRARYGISYWVVPEGAMDDLAPVVSRLAGS